LSYYTTLRAKIKDFPVCGHSCGQSRFSAQFGDLAKRRKRPCRKAFRASAFTSVDGVRTTPKPGALPTALHPDIKLIIAKKLRKVKNHELAKLWSKKAILTTIRKNDRCIHCAATTRFSNDIKIILLGKFPKQARYQLRNTPLFAFLLTRRCFLPCLISNSQRFCTCRIFQRRARHSQPSSFY